MLATPAPELAAMAAAGRETVRERFGIDAMAAALADAYRATCGQHGRGLRAAAEVPGDRADGAAPAGR
ncbi:hypothetical protein OH807_02825 [Kitasatospora sp. NBC_01560]|uniref:hypothetical protein n=1 Tax=Kitasatospora sp. NBC_01560 TaxID=2975965 RepID=UPI003868F981